MGTRAYIIVKVNDSDLGRPLSFDRAKLSPDLKVIDEDSRLPISNDIFVETKSVDAPYLAIYMQFDGYPDGVGAALLQHFNDYSSALNLMAGGTIESLAHNVLVYCPERRRSLEQDFHTNAYTPEQHHHPAPCESYQYLFYQGRWYVRQSGSLWYDLEKLLTSHSELINDSFPKIKLYRQIPWSSGANNVNYYYERYESKWLRMLPVGRGLARIPSAHIRA